MPNPPPPSRGGWRLVPYVTDGGRSPVLEFLEDLRAQAFQKYVVFTEVLRPQIEASGPFAVGPPHWENLGDGWHDIRWGRCRIYCSVEDPRLIVMYVGVVKRWAKFDASDRRLCERYRADFLSVGYDQEARVYRYRARKSGNRDRSP